MFCSSREKRAARLREASVSPEQGTAPSLFDSAAVDALGGFLVITTLVTEDKGRSGRQEKKREKL